MDEIETVIDLISNADTGPIDRPIYNGSFTDLAYLKEWMLDLATDVYGVDRSVFDEPTITSTTIIRDLVHRLVYEHLDLPIYRDLLNAGEATDFRQDIGALLRVEGWALCGEIAKLLNDTYTALGYKAVTVNSISGDVGRIDDAHLTVDVKLNDGSWMTQDATFNFFHLDDTGNPLSFIEARELQFSSPDSLNFIAVNSHTYMGKAARGGQDGFAPATEESFRANYLGLVVGIQSGVEKQYFDYYLDRYTPHTSAQGGTYSNEAAAVAQAQDVEGLDLVGALDALREEGYASGFRLVDLETGSLVGEYVTLQLDDGRYVTIERGTLLSFDGGYDQIVDKINRGTSDLDPSRQAAFLNPVIVITARGEIVNHWQFGDDFQYYADLLADRIAAPAYSTDADGNTVRIDVFGEGSDRRAEWHYFDSAGLQTRTETFFRDITHDRTDYDPTDALDWSQQTWNYTANDMLEALTIAYDDGTRIQIDYDPADVFDWYYRQSNFNAAGDLTQLVERYQDGTNSRVDYDPTNVADWSQRIWNYTADQALETLTIAYDDGTRIQIDYDPADVFAWNFRQSNFNAAGDLTLVTLRNPDGTSSQIKYFYGLAGNDTLTGGTGTDVLVGRQGADVLIGGAGADALFGGSGVDVASYETATAGVIARLDHPNLNAGDAAGDTYSEVESLRGSSYADMLCGDAAANTLAGWAGNDSLWGYGGGDTLDGGDGNDYLVGAAGADTFIGGAGGDTVSYYFAAAGLTARLDHPRLSTGEALGDSYSGIENLYGSKFIDTLCGNAGANVLTGWEGNDSLWGYGGGDTLDGGEGNDYLVGAAGADAFIGGAGSDTVSYYFATSGVIANLAAPASNTGEALGDSYSGIENLYGSKFADTLCGNAGANVLTGREGNDTLWGYGGGDAFIGGAGSDTVSYYFAAAGLTARLDHPRLNTGEALGDSYSGIENLYGSKFIDTLCGNAGANVLTGREGNDSLWGYGGGDTLDGGDGNDYLVGAAGADAFIGGAGSDTVSYNFATSGVVANLAAPAGNTGEALGDSYSGIENILGSAYNDTLTGNSGSNFLQGGKGNDTLIGGADGDALSGGEGNDTFVFRLGEASGDVITDFLGNGANPGDQLTFEGFGAGATFTSIDATHWQVNYNGGTAHEIITFSNPVSIHSTDVIFA